MLRKAKLIKNALSANARLFEQFRSSAVLKNVVYEVKVNELLPSAFSKENL